MSKNKNTRALLLMPPDLYVSLRLEDGKRYVRYDTSASIETEPNGLTWEYLRDMWLRHYLRATLIPVVDAAFEELEREDTEL